MLSHTHMKLLKHIFSLISAPYSRRTGTVGSHDMLIHILSIMPCLDSQREGWRKVERWIILSPVCLSTGHPLVWTPCAAWLKEWEQDQKHIFIGLHWSSLILILLYENSLTFYMLERLPLSFSINPEHCTIIICKNMQQRQVTRRSTDNQEKNAPEPENWYQHWVWGCREFPITSV